MAPLSAAGMALDPEGREVTTAVAVETGVDIITEEKPADGAATIWPLAFRNFPLPALQQAGSLSQQ